MVNYTREISTKEEIQIQKKKKIHNNLYVLFSVEDDPRLLFENVHEWDNSLRQLNEDVAPPLSMTLCSRCHSHKGERLRH